MKYCFFILSVLLSTCSIAQPEFKVPTSFEHPLLKQMTDSILSGKYEEITSVLVAIDGELIYENYFNDHGPESKHNVRSGTKTMAMILVGLAIKKGHIESVKDPIMKYLKHKRPVLNPDDRKEAITIEDLLTMSSCLECNDDEQHSRGNEMRMYFIEDWTKFYLDLPIKAYPWGPTPETAEYGRVFSYCTAGAACLSEIVQSAVGMSSADFLAQEVLEPLGITDYEFHYNPEGTLNTAGGSEYRSRDFMKIIQMLADDGSYDGNQILSTEWIQKATSPKANAWEGMNYGYLLWLKEFGKEKPVASYAMAGNGGQKILCIPELNLTVVLTTTNYNNRRAHGYTDELLDQYIVPAVQRIDKK